MVTLDRDNSASENSTEQTRKEAGTILVRAMDKNSNGRLDVEDFIILGMSLPGISIDRAAFLRKTLSGKFSEKTVEEAINTTPARAGIPPEDVDYFADRVIKSETRKVTGLSAILRLPFSVLAIPAIVADVSQYYGYTLHAAQKLLYLYGFPQIKISSEKPDKETMNVMILALGAMYGRFGSGRALGSLARAVAVGMERGGGVVATGAVYPIIAGVTEWINARIARDMLAWAVNGRIPIAGMAIGGGMTYFTFKASCKRLKASLRDTVLANPTRARSWGDGHREEALEEWRERHRAKEKKAGTDAKRKNLGAEKGKKSENSPQKQTAPKCPSPDRTKSHNGEKSGKAGKTHGEPSLPRGEKKRDKTPAEATAEPDTGEPGENIEIAEAEGSGSLE